MVGEITHPTSSICIGNSGSAGASPSAEIPLSTFLRHNKTGMSRRVVREICNSLAHLQRLGIVGAPLPRLAPFAGLRPSWAEPGLLPCRTSGAWLLYLIEFGG